MMHLLQRQRARLGWQWPRIQRLGWRRTLGYYSFTVLLEKIGVEIVHVYRCPAVADKSVCLTRDPLADRNVCPTESIQTVVVYSLEELTNADLQALRACRGEGLIDEFRRCFAQGQRCALTRVEGGQLASIAWAARVQAYPGGQSAGGRAWLIQQCYTFPRFRGRGLYPATLAHVCRELMSAERCVADICIESSVANSASIRGIEKAGFVRVGTKCRLGAWRKYFPAAKAGGHNGAVRPGNAARVSRREAPPASSRESMAI